MASLGWGLDPWGLGSFGSLPGPLFLVSASALSTRTVRVVVSVPPIALDDLPDVGDALNPATWVISRPGFVYTTAHIMAVDSVTFDITVVEAFGAAAVVHTVSSTTLEKPTREFIEAPLSLTFAGVVSSDEASPQAKLTKRRYVSQDLANPYVDGTLVMSPAGDYQLVSGAEMVKKLILRRLTTPKGGFFHLPEYGIGLAVKEPVITSSLILLRREIERQILLEPDVAEVGVQLLMNASAGILTVKSQTRLKTTGETFEQSFNLPTGA